MSHQAEVEYIANVVKAFNVTRQEIEEYLARKPFSDPARATFLMDLAQVTALLPPPPARVLDMGCGSGWTSEFLARSGYEVLGLDLAPEMVHIARRRIAPPLVLSFEVGDYEEPFPGGAFDAVVIYDALHHAQAESRVASSAFQNLKDGGIFVSIEPGTGHSASQATRETVAKLRTTEKDMPYEHQARLLTAAGFTTVRQFLRLSQFVLEDISSGAGRVSQAAGFQHFVEATSKGLTSIVVARK